MIDLDDYHFFKSLIVEIVIINFKVIQTVINNNTYKLFNVFLPVHCPFLKFAYFVYVLYLIGVQKKMTIYIESQRILETDKEPKRRH